MAKKEFKIGSNLAEALDETVQSATNNIGELHVEIIPLQKIDVDPDNPREFILTFSDLQNGVSKSDPHAAQKKREQASLDGIANSIKNHGIINPITVYKNEERYKLIAGERRSLGSLLAGETTIPAKIMLKKPNPFELSLIQWIENIERDDLSLWERLRNLEKIIKSYSQNKSSNKEKITPAKLAKILGCSIQQGVNYLHILNGSEELLENIKKRNIKNIDKAAFIGKSQPEMQGPLIKACIAGTTLKKLKERVQSNRSNIEQKTKKKGSQIVLGSTDKVEVLKTLINLTIKEPHFAALKNDMEKINWSDNNSISTGFKRFISSLEKIIKG